MTLCNQYGDYVVPLITEYIKDVASEYPDCIHVKILIDRLTVAPATDLPSILRKEALYCAVGRCAHRLKDSIPFEEWLNNSLAVEALNPVSEYRIIKRRIAWLFGKWFAESNLSDSKAKVYEVLVQLMQSQGEGSDPVVRLTAATALKDCIDVRLPSSLLRISNCKIVN